MFQGSKIIVKVSGVQTTLNFAFVFTVGCRRLRQVIIALNNASTTRAFANEMTAQLPVNQPMYYTAGI